jgi:16S rRNA (guanine966-N2)-methyltransferase
MISRLSIIGGRFKGMKLHQPDGDVTRPLRAPVKKSLFDILSEEIPEASCLDLFAGSGSIGIEAISRGASSCVFVESDARVFGILQKNIDKISRGGDNSPIQTRLVRADVIEFLEYGPPGEAPFDIVFLDPPFAARASAFGSLELLGRDEGWMHPGGRVVYHFRGELEMQDVGWRIVDSRVFGECRLAFLQRGCG